MAHPESDPIAAGDDERPADAILHRRNSRVTRALVLALCSAVLGCLGVGVGLGVHLAGQPREGKPQTAETTDPEGLGASVATSSPPAESTSCDRAVELARQYAVMGDYDAALSALDELTGARLSAVERRRVERMRRKIREAMVSRDCRRGLQLAEIHTRAKRFDEAQDALAQVSGRLQQARLMGHLSRERYESLEAVAAERRRQLTDARRYDDAITAAERAKRSGDRGAEQAALERALAAAARAPVSAARERVLRRRLADAKARIALAEVLARAKSASPDEALRLLREFARRHPGHIEATRAIVEASAQQGRQRLVEQGDAAFAAGKWSEARARYTRAATLGKDAALTEKIQRCDHETAMARARKSRKAKRYKDALAAADAARAAWPAGADKTRAWQDETRLEQKHESDLAEAKSAVAAGNWAAAKTALDRIKSTAPEVSALRAKVAMEQHVESARTEMLRGNYPAARAHLKTARDHAPAGGKKRREIDALIARIDSLLRPVAPVRVAIPAGRGGVDDRRLLPRPEDPSALPSRLLYGDIRFGETFGPGYFGGYVDSWGGYYGGYGGGYSYYPRQVWGNPYRSYHSRNGRGYRHQTTTGTTSSRSRTSGHIRFGSPGGSGFRGSIHINR